MARYLLVLKPRSVVQPRALIEALKPMLQVLQAEVDHETIAHLSAVVRVSGEQQRDQTLFMDVIFAPFSRRILRTSRCPLRAARWSGVCPSLDGQKNDRSATSFRASSSAPSLMRA